MKSTLTTLLILTLSLMMACTDNPIQNSETDQEVFITQKLKDNSTKNKTRKLKDGKFKAKKFKAEFFSSGGLQFDLDPITTADICGAGPYLLNIQEGYGTGTFIGRFTYYATFCVDVSQFGVGPIPFFATEKTIQYLATPAGDTLFIPLEDGLINSSEVTGYDLQFTGTVISSEGTGRLTNVTIEATTLGLVILEPERTDHSWKGTIQF